MPAPRSSPAPGRSRSIRTARSGASQPHAPLKEVYFQDDGCRVGQLEEVGFTDIEHLEFDL
ncbi:hypothetical protein ACFCYB_18070 [Streptomyces sp. NPDC056309]